jgi:hypothetical protein
MSYSLESGRHCRSERGGEVRGGLFRTGASRRCKAASGSTLVEMMLAAGVAVLVAGTATLMFLDCAKEDRRVFGDASVQEGANVLESKLLARLRVMSATQSAAFAQPVFDTAGNLLGYQCVVVSQGPPPDYTPEAIVFQPGAGQVVHYPNFANTNNPDLLLATNSSLALRRVDFLPSLKPDGTPDTSLINVTIDVDDNGYSQRQLYNASTNPATLWRTFSVKMRNQ